MFITKETQDGKQKMIVVDQSYYWTLVVDDVFCCFRSDLNAGGGPIPLSLLIPLNLDKFGMTVHFCTYLHHTCEIVYVRK